MQSSIFHRDTTQSEDKVEQFFRKGANGILVGIFGLLPLLMLPVTFLPFDYVKTVYAIVACLCALILLSLSVLRSGQLRMRMPLALGVVWAVVLVTLVSAVLSGDMQDALIGELFGVHTTVFVALLAVVVTLLSLCDLSKSSIIRFYMLLTASSIILVLFHVSRLLFGANFLSLGVFTDAVQTPVGGWNDLALLLGLSVVLSLVALEQLPLTKWGRGIFIGGIILSLIMLAVINFFAVWIILALISLVTMMYGLTKDRFRGQTLTTEGRTPFSFHSVIVPSAVLVVALVFVIGGSVVGGFISKQTGISYIEVRPSFEATVDIAREVYTQNNAFLGIGPNKFVDAWRWYKDASINQTLFWDTDFVGGNGYITTLFVTTGIIGVCAWLLFFGLFLLIGFRLVFKTVHADRFWYFIGSSSFIASVYLWGISFIYVPGATILLLAAFFTGITLTAYAALVGVRSYTLSATHNARTGLVLIGIVMLVIVTCASALFYLAQHYTAIYTYGSAVTNATAETEIDVLEQQIVSAHDRFHNDVFARQIALYQIAKIQTLLTLTEPTDAQREVFQTAIQNGISSAVAATELDPTNAVNWAVLGRIYSILAGAGIEGAQERALEAFATAKRYAPKNPSYILLEAQLYSQTNELALARVTTEAAIRMKPNYTEALFFLAQLDIAEGNIQAAIATTQSILSLEPNNPARYYQLGVLQLTAENIPQAVIALERAVALDTNYANARYYLALAYSQQDKTEEAITQLEKVLELNPGNEQVVTLLAQLGSGESITLPQRDAEAAIVDPEAVVESDGGVTTTQDPNTPLVTPVNTVADTREESVTNEGQ